jgi:cytochrome c553
MVMRGCDEIEVEPRGGGRWPRSPVAPAAFGEDNARGKELYQLCAQCHGAAGEGNQLALAPAIAGLGEWYIKAQLHNFKSGARGTHSEDTGGLRMYPMSQTLKTDADLDAIAAFVAALAPARPAPVLTGGDPARGAQLYQVCLACHGPDGAGNQAMGSPRISGASDWYRSRRSEVEGRHPRHPPTR